MKRVRVLAVVIAATTAIAVNMANAAPGPAGLSPHRAIYHMALASTRAGSGVAGATGTMSYQFGDSCDGWIVENRIAVTYSYTEGGQADTTTDFLTWESKDGLRYRFRMRNTRDGQVTDDIEGTAELKGKGLGGTAKFTRPEVVSIPLPKGTLFPTEHTVKLMEAAQGGNHSLLRVVFDGSDAQGPYDVNALIGKSHAMEANSASPLLDSPSLAFFPLDSQESTPDFEMRLNYHDNGVAQNIIQAFKNFSLEGRLESIEPLPKHGC